MVVVVKGVGLESWGCSSLFWLFRIRIHEDPGLFAFEATVLWVLQEARLAGVGILSGWN